MPALYAHNRFGNDVLATLPPSLKDFFVKYTEAFHLGLQGPDILFYYKPLTKNTIKRYGVTSRAWQSVLSRRRRTYFKRREK